MRTVDGWAYTATVIDVYSRTVVGDAVADHRLTPAWSSRHSPRPW
ncbi:hypothetical protein [Bounagaea algeriensis]